MWEIFSGGRNPYPAVDPISLTQMLKEGGRLETPNNTTCSLEMYIQKATVSIMPPSRKSSIQYYIVAFLDSYTI